MRSFILPAWVRLIVLLAATFLLSTWIDKHLDIASPLVAQAANAVIPAVAVLPMWGMAGRAWFALVGGAALLGALDYADRVKMANLNTDLVYADFTVIGGLLKDPRLVLGFVHFTPMKIAAAVTAIIAVAAAFWFSRHAHHASCRRFRLGVSLPGLLAGVFIWNYSAPDVVESLQWEVSARPLAPTG